MPATDLAFLDEVESTIQQLLAQLPELEEALQTESILSHDSILNEVSTSLDSWNRKLGEMAATLGGVSDELERNQSEVRSWSETFAQSRRRAEKLRG